MRTFGLNVGKSFAFLHLEKYLLEKPIYGLFFMKIYQFFEIYFLQEKDKEQVVEINLGCGTILYKDIGYL